MADLLPCPFCGGTDGDGYSIDHGDGACDEAHCCADCGAEGPPGPSLDAADTLWNARPEEERLRSALQAATQSLDRLNTVAHEAFGPFPVQSPEEDLTAIEQGVFALRRKLVEAERERDEARTELERDQEFMVRVAQERDRAIDQSFRLESEVMLERSRVGRYRRGKA